MDYEVSRFWLDLVQAGATVGLYLYVWITRRTSVNKNAIDRVDSKVHELEKRVVGIDECLRHVPSHEDIAAIYEVIRDNSNTLSLLAREISSNAAKLTALCVQVATMNDFLLKQTDKV